MSNRAPNFLADGDINPSRFVTQDGASGDNRVLQSTANLRIAGVSQQSTKNAPVSGGSALAASQNDAVEVYGPNEQCLLTFGGTIVAGDILRSDANGKAVAVKRDGTITGVQYYGARALEGGVSGEIHRVVVDIGTFTYPSSGTGT